MTKSRVEPSGLHSPQPNPAGEGSRATLAPAMTSLAHSPEVATAARALVRAVRHAANERQSDPQHYAEALATLGRMRGQPMAHPLLAGGVGEGARVRLADGRSLLDFVSGIGPYVFGHSDPDLLETAVVAAASDVAYQGHVLPGLEYYRLSRLLLRHAGPRFDHVWLALSGSMANENALKIILQKHAPAQGLVSFTGSFHGRTLAISELTDRPGYREGLPLRGNVFHIPFYSAADPESTRRSVHALEGVLAAHPGQIAAMCFELVQGEGGFNDAPPAFFEALMQCCRRSGVAVWVDEIQTFARTGELFAFRTLGLDELVDVVTCGKILHGSATLFGDDYRPRPGLVAGTWAGSTVGMAIGARILERLENEGYLGRGGGIEALAARVDHAFDALATRLPAAVGPRSGLGAMKAFIPWQGESGIVRELIEVAIEEGVLLQPAGSDPTKIRMLPPLNLGDEELAAGFAALERAMRRIAQEHGLPLA